MNWPFAITVFIVPGLIIGAYFIGFCDGMKFVQDLREDFKEIREKHFGEKE